MKKLLIIPFALFVLCGCGEKSDMKDTFCGFGIDARYCKCAFHGEYCDGIGMSKGEAKDYVYEKYEEWKNPDLDKLKEDCIAKNGVFFGRTCMLCGQDEIATETKCVPASEVDVEEVVVEDDVIEDVEKGECKYDDECAAICEGDIKWKRGCNARTNTCEKTFDTNCSSDVEVFGGLNFPKMCNAGACVRDVQSIEQMKIELQSLKDESIDDAKLTNAQRQELQVVMMDANKNCINGIADMTNVAIVEFGTRVGSIVAGGLPGLADVAVDYVNDAINKLTAQDKSNLPKEQKLKPDEYIALNCGLYNHFKNYLAIADAELDNDLDTAHEIDDVLQALP